MYFIIPAVSLNTVRMFWRSLENININIIIFHCVVCATEAWATCVVLSACVTQRISQWTDIRCHSFIPSFIHSVNLFFQSFSALYNSEQSTEAIPPTAELGYICTYDECCVRKETSLHPHCLTVDQAERTSATSPDINKGQTSLKYVDHKSPSAAPISEGYNYRDEFRRQKK